MPTVERARNSLLKDLEDMCACRESITWIRRRKFSTWKQAWDGCNAGDRMVWLLVKLDVPFSYRMSVVKSIQDYYSDDFYFQSILRNSADSACLDVYFSCQEQKKHLKACADLVRQIVPWSVIRDGLEWWHKEYNSQKNIIRKGDNHEKY